jgi:hypothetical protein
VLGRRLVRRLDFLEYSNIAYDSRDIDGKLKMELASIGDERGSTYVMLQVHTECARR